MRRTNIYLDTENLVKCEHIKSITNLNRSEIIRASIEHYYNFVKRGFNMPIDDDVVFEVREG